MILTRFHKQEKLDLEVEFLTPTFLGGADQNGELRSPPFKNLFRQWWRVANGHLDADCLLCKEGKLFGSVLDKDDSSASRVRFSILKSEHFQLSNTLPQLPKFIHPEVKSPKTGNQIPLNRFLYLGYGPIDQKKGPDGKYRQDVRMFINSGSKIVLKLTFPKYDIDSLLQAVKLINFFGTIGGRSRNGFGSIAISGKDIDIYDLSFLKSIPLSCFYDSKNVKKYPYGFGSDNKGVLCWENKINSKPWESVLGSFAELYMNLRVSFPFRFGNTKEKRHILGYPAGENHKVEDWETEHSSRMPSQLRLMVKRDKTGNIVGRILHLPHLLPKPWDAAKLGSELDVWKQVHGFLDNRPELKRFGGAR